MKISDVIGCVGSALLFLVASAWIPVLGPFLSLLSPLPFLYYSTKLGLLQGVQIVFVTLVVVGVVAQLAGYPQIIFFCLEFGILGLLISEIYRREYPFGLTIFWGTGYLLLIGAAVLFVIGLSKRMGPVEVVLDYFQGNLEETIRAYEGMGWEEARLQQIRDVGQVLTDVVAKVYPALLIVGTGLMVWVNVVLSRPLFRLGKLKYPDFGPMDRWQAPEVMVWGLIAAGFSLFLSAPGVTWMAYNVLIVMSVIYVFHGLAIVLFFFNKYGVPSWVRVFAYLLIVFQQIFLLGLALAGLFDQWVDFRKLHKKAD